PAKKGTHGGERTSSVCRGGEPTHCLSEGMVPAPGGDWSGGEPASPAGPAPPLPSPSPAKLPWLALLELPGTGAYSAVWLGLACGRLRAEGRAKMARRRARATATSGG